MTNDRVVVTDASGRVVHEEPLENNRAASFARPIFFCRTTGPTRFLCLAANGLHAASVPTPRTRRHCASHLRALWRSYVARSHRARRAAQTKGGRLNAGAAAIALMKLLRLVTSNSGHVHRNSSCLLWAKSGHGAVIANLSSIVPIGAHQHAPHFKCAAAAALESEKVAHIAFSLDPEQSHLEIALRAAWFCRATGRRYQMNQDTYRTTAPLWVVLLGFPVTRVMLAAVLP